MPNEKPMPPQRRQPGNTGQQQGGNDLPSQQQHGGLTPVNEQKLPEPRKPDIEDPEDALEEDHYDRIV